MTVAQVIDRRRAVLKERMRAAEQLGMFDLAVAAAIVEEQQFLLELLRAYVAELRDSA